MMRPVVRVSKSKKYTQPCPSFPSLFVSDKIHTQKIYDVDDDERRE
jgi:hypothetical protein